MAIMSTNAELVARSTDDNGYGSSNGVGAYVEGDEAYLIHIHHCSCYSTWDEHGRTEIWQGTKAELLAMAKRNADPDMPDRTMEEKDSDYSDMQKVYAEIIAKLA